ncbi:MAG: OadG family protein [Lachnospiraceae bacterium]
MKKFLTVLCMITCIFGLTACGKEKEVINYDEASLRMTCESVYQNVCMDGPETADLIAQLKSMDEVDLGGIEDLFRQNGVKISGKALIKGMESYQGARAVIGERSEIKSFTVEPKQKTLVTKLLVTGTLHDAEIEVVFDDKLTVTSVTINPQYSFAEKMERAALNTLMGMGTVFAVLILISLIISAFSYIPKIQEKLAKKNKEVTVTTADVVDNTIAQIIQKEEMADDSELVAVIAAAIAASTGTSTDGFVVRSIKRANTNKWQNN